MSGRARVVLVALALQACGGSRPPDWPPPMRADLGARDAAFRWPARFAPDEADVFAHNRRTVAAPCARVWAVLVAAPRWPEWYEHARDVRLADGGETLRSGSRFTWSTFGFAVESTIAELEPGKRLAWFGRARDLDAYHAWLLRDVVGGCDVTTEEVGRGPAAKELRRKNPEALHAGHDVWLQSLDAAARR